MASMRLMLLLLVTWLCFSQALQVAFEDLKVDTVRNDAKNNCVGGRKMSVDRRSMEVEEISVGKMKELVEIMDVKRTARHEVGKGGGFVAFNADYHSPMHHPPKNN